MIRFNVFAPIVLLGSCGLLVACGDDSTSGTGGSSSTSSGSSTSTTSSGGPSTSSSTSSGPSTTSASSGGGGDAGTGGQGGAGPGAGGAGGDGSGGGATVFPDDCTTADDCPGGDCVEIASGFFACQFPVEEATECTSELDQCCSTDDCGDGGGLCVHFPDASYCGGPQPADQNVCSGLGGCIDCAKGGGTCLDAGFYGYNVGQCIPRTCFDDADCSDEAGGRCVPVFASCCSAVTGFLCAYPSDGCRADTDCDQGEFCESDLEAGRARCVVGDPPCPL